MSVKPSCLNGIRRTRLPVAAKIALASAGAIAATPTSPAPALFSSLGKTVTSISGTFVSGRNRQLDDVGDETSIPEGHCKSTCMSRWSRLVPTRLLQDRIEDAQRA